VEEKVKKKKKREKKHNIMRKKNQVLINKSKRMSINQNINKILFKDSLSIHIIIKSEIFCTITP
jgi:hypothetical protein